MTNPEATPELENKAYTESQKEMIDVVKSLYSHISNLNEKAFHYRAVDNEIKFMYFDKKLSAYPDAFHTGNSSQEFGEFSENSPEEKVYLEAFQHDNGGNK